MPLQVNLLLEVIIYSCRSELKTFYCIVEALALKLREHLFGNYPYAIIIKSFTQDNHIARLVQERRHSSVLAMELRLSCTKPLISCHNISHRWGLVVTRLLVTAFPSIFWLNTCKGFVVVTRQCTHLPIFSPCSWTNIPNSLKISLISKISPWMKKQNH